MNTRPNLRTLAIALTTLWLPITYLVTQLVTAWLKQNNPDNVNITAGLAYLRQGLLTALVTATVLIAIDVFFIVKMYRAERNFTSAKLPLTLLAVSVCIMGLVLVTNGYIDSVEDQYRETHLQSNN